MNAKSASKEGFRVAVVVDGTEQIVAMGGFVPAEIFGKAAVHMANLHLVLLPPAHSLHGFKGEFPSPVPGAIKPEHATTERPAVRKAKAPNQRISSLQFVVAGK